MSQDLKNDIAKGESLAEMAMRKVFEFGAGLAPETDMRGSTRPRTDPEERISNQRTTMNATLRSRETSRLPFRAEDFAGDGKRHLLLACSGSVATIKLPSMLQALSVFYSTLSIRVILTESATRFLEGQSAEQPDVASLQSITGVDGIYFDADEWQPRWTRGAPILHIELRRWADALVIAPLSANSLAKMVNGMCDSLLLSVVRAWDTEAMMGWYIEKAVDPTASSPTDVAAPKIRPAATQSATATETQIVRRRKTILVAPAMNSAMWSHPMTKRQLDMLKEEWHWTHVLLPVDSKALACGDVGAGAMKEWSQIVDDIIELLKLNPAKAPRTSIVAD